MQHTLTTSPAAMTAGPLYKQVKGLLTEGLAKGEWPPGAAIPSEARLAERFRVSIGTVRKAIDELVAENILIRQQGRGTFVATHNQSHYLFHFFHIVGEDGTRQFPRTDMLAFERGRADTRTARALQLQRSARVIRIRNLLRLDEAPVEVNEITVSATRFPDLDEETFARRPGTIYQFYEDRYAISVIRTSERVRAMAAPPQAARALGLEPGSPVLSIERTAFTYNDTPVEFRCSWVNTARHVYQSDLGD